MSVRVNIIREALSKSTDPILTGKLLLLINELEAEEAEGYHEVSVGRCELCGERSLCNFCMGSG
jgi:hypothetical protein|tara:strand:- start:255 stop:446 length:192 start_codon:yes stop_codon:yes gene_type:complete